ncbi:MAG TPA: FAD/NAD(P)-binding protein [Steroidobacteraceae bacterium]|nr:FAD/NAD(P)-binding protein [Steroidobacteraceae bacterium]
MTASAELAAPAAGAMVPEPYRVRRRRRETSDTWTLTLEPLAGEGISPAPGQFTMVYAFGIGEIPISVSGIDDGYLVHTVRAVGAVSAAICAAKPGAVLGVRGPFGTAWPLANALGHDVVVVAGGVGLAPLRTAVQSLERAREDYGEVTLLYGGRTPGDLLFRAELDQLRRRGRMRLDVTVDAARPDWAGKVGVVPKLIDGARFDPASVVALVCGPEIMMDFSVTALLDRGVLPERIYLSMERNMRCAIGHCGHCQLGPTLVCRDGPVYSYEHLAPLMAVREL